MAKKSTPQWYTAVGFWQEDGTPWLQPAKGHSVDEALATAIRTTMKGSDMTPEQMQDLTIVDVVKGQHVSGLQNEKILSAYDVLK